MKRPNILYIFADQMRSTAMGCAGVEKVRTPNLDRFATQGTRFTNAVSNTPLCCPARATLLTGLHTLSHEVVFNDKLMRTDLRCFAHCLNDAGYRSGYVGKWHLDTADRACFVPPGPRRRGFDDFFAINNCNHDYFQAYYYLNDCPEPVWIDGYEPDAQTDLAITQIQRMAAGDNPFCMFLSWGPPHCPYGEVPQKYLDMYPPDQIELMPSARDAALAWPKDLTPEQADRMKREMVAGYYAQITALDDCFGRLMKAVDDAGIAENTIVVFSSDHGDMLFNHNRGWKCKPWRESIGIPLIVRWPGRVAEGRVSGGPIGIVDHMPTLLSMAGVQIPEGVEGEDLSAFVLGCEGAAPDSQFLSFPVVPATYSYPEWRGVVTRTHTYARFRDRAWVLYDDVNDPSQINNLADSPEHEPVRRELDAKLQAWLERTADPFEPSRVVADKHYQGHVDMVMPCYENDAIRAGKQARAERK